MTRPAGSDRREEGGASERGVSEDRRLFWRVERGEWALFFASAGYFFCLLCAYYVLRPVRETAGIAGQENVLHLLFLATFTVMLIAVPIYGALVARVPRVRFIAGSTCVFAAQLLLLVFCFRVFPEARVSIGRVFFVWLSVFNLYVVSIFWSLMVERWTHSAGKRLFGPIMAAGSTGGLVGSSITARAESLPSEDLMVIATLILLATLGFLAWIANLRPVAVRIDDRPLGGSVLAGLRTIVRSSYLRRAAGWLFILTLCGTLVYLSKNELVKSTTLDEAKRRTIFANIDFATTALTFALQLFGVSLLLRLAGVGFSLALLPVVYLAGFASVALAPAFLTIVLFEVFRRGFGYGVASPSREILFTVVSTEEKYKSKACIDTLVYRGGDALSAQVFAFLFRFLPIAGIALAALPVCVGWIFLSRRLGREVTARVGDGVAGDGVVTTIGNSRRG